MESMERVFISAEEVAEVMDISKSYAYKVIARMNRELGKKGYHAWTDRPEVLL